MGDYDIDYDQGATTRPDLRPVAFVAQLGTSYRDFTEPSNADASYSHFRNSPQIFSRPFCETSSSCETSPSGTLDSQAVQETEMPRSDHAVERGQGDAGRHSSLHRDSGIHDVPDEELGAVGGAVGPRLPLLNIPLPDASCLAEPLRPIFDHDRPLSPPVPVAEVEDQAAVIIQGFFEQRWRQESGEAPDELHVIQAGPPGLSSITRSLSQDDHLSPSHAHRTHAAATSRTDDKSDTYKNVSAKLNTIAQEIDQRYSKEFEEMIDLLKVNSSTAYEAFAGVAKTMLSGGISWSKVIALLVFGYRMARRVVDLAIPNFLQNIVGYMVTFICKHVAKWIAARGGWVAILKLEEGISWTGFCSIMTLGFGILAAVSWLKNR